MLFITFDKHDLVDILRRNPIESVVFKYTCVHILTLWQNNIFPCKPCAHEPIFCDFFLNSLVYILGSGPDHFARVKRMPVLTNRCPTSGGIHRIDIIIFIGYYTDIATTLNKTQLNDNPHFERKSYGQVI